jgi:hypothetical protein
MLLTGYLKDKSIPIDLVCPVGLRVVVTELRIFLTDLVCPVGLRVVVTELRIFLTATFVLVGSGKEG